MCVCTCVGRWNNNPGERAKYKHTRKSRRQIILLCTRNKVKSLSLSRRRLLTCAAAFVVRLLFCFNKSKFEKVKENVRSAASTWYVSLLCLFAYGSSSSVAVVAAVKSPISLNLKWTTVTTKSSLSISLSLSLSYQSLSLDSLKFPTTAAAVMQLARHHHRHLREIETQWHRRRRRRRRVTTGGGARILNNRNKKERKTKEHLIETLKSNNQGQSFYRTDK